jgi:hypothetical protein
LPPHTLNTWLLKLLTRPNLKSWGKKVLHRYVFAKIKEQQIHALICLSTIQHCSTRLKTFLQNLKNNFEDFYFLLWSIWERGEAQTNHCAMQQPIRARWGSQLQLLLQK